MYIYIHICSNYVYLCIYGIRTYDYGYLACFDLLPLVLFFFLFLFFLFFPTLLLLLVLIPAFVYSYSSSPLSLSLSFFLYWLCSVFFPNEGVMRHRPTGKELLELSLRRLMPRKKRPGASLQSVEDKAI